VFGYGSLINADSRAVTGVSGRAVAARLRGWQRSWNVTATKLGMTALGITPASDAAMNGVVVQVSEGEIHRFDERERGYARREVFRSSCTSYRGDGLPEGRIWVYVPEQPREPTEECPIAQSYVDVVLSGCLDIDEAFAREFVRTTTNWHGCPFDDRERPQYPRAIRDLPRERIAAIDRILKEEVP
jgi:hypothetical protein